MATIPRTQYARNGDVSIAYAVTGDGPVDLVFSSGVISHIEHLWEEPGIRRFLERTAGMARLIVVDPRGSGMSDSVPPNGLDEVVGDYDAVLDAAGSTRAAMMGYTTAGPGCIEYAVARPDRVSHLILYGSMARMTWAPDYEWAFTEAQREAAFGQQMDSWGEGRMIERVAPSRASDPGMREWFARFERLSASPGNMREIWRRTGNIDVRPQLPLIVAPTLVLHRRDDALLDVRHSRYLAEHIPGARYVELEGSDSLISAGDPEPILGEIEEFLTGARARASQHQRALRTVLFTDIVAGTERAAREGDARWRELLAAQEAVTHREVLRYGGAALKSTGDGVLATFAGPPSAAVRCAREIAHEVGALGVDVRIGLHTGEVELVGDDVAGMAVNIAARVCALAGAGQVYASGTTFGTVVGGDLPFEWVGERELKGVPARWPIFELQV